MTKDANGNFVVSNMDEMLDMYYQLLEMTDQVYLRGFSVEKFPTTPTVIKFDSGNENGEGGYVTAEMAQLIIKIQDQIYKIARAQKGGNLTKEEKKNLELQVTVRPGCTELVFDVISNLILEVKNMSMDQLTTIGDILVKALGVMAIWKVGVPVAKGAFSSVQKKIDLSRKKMEAESREKLAQLDLEKTRIEAEVQLGKTKAEHEEDMAQIEFEGKEALANIEKEKEIAIAHEKAWSEALDKSLNVIEAASNGNGDLCRQLSKSPCSISVNRVSYSKEELEEYAKAPEEQQEVEEPETKTYKGLFQIQKKDYSKSGDAVQVKLKSMDGQYEVEAPLPPDLFSSDQLNEIEHKKPVYLSLTGDWKDGKFKGNPSIIVLKYPEDGKENQGEA